MRFLIHISFDFWQALSEFHVELVEDPIIKAHLESLYDTMLEQNLCRIIEPYSRVQVYRICLFSLYKKGACKNDVNFRYPT